MSEYEAAEFAPEPKPEREGLPRGYRMRADSHYVDALTSPRDTREPREPRGREASARTASADHHTQADRRLFDQLAEDVAAIESAAAMLAADASPLARRVGLDLIKAQSARAAWLLRATALIGGAEQDTAPRRKLVTAFLSEIRDRLAVECRLVGVALEVDAVEPADLGVWADSALSVGVTGAVMAQLGMLHGADQPVIRLRAAGSRGELTSVEISQETASLPASQQNRFFDPSWTARPGGWLAGLGAAAAKSATDRLGGSVSLPARDTRGCTIRLSWE